MKVAKVIVEAPVCSFRHPHFLVGQQPTYEMPPPSTVYGHVCSAAGKLLNPTSFRFAYTFEFAGRAWDLEYQHVVKPAGGKLKINDEVYPKTTEGDVQPHSREFLFGAKLTLYLEPADLVDYFRRPQYVVILGRSQDLACIVEAREIELKEAPGAYFENTLLPFSLRPMLPLGITTLMPRYIEPPPSRRATLERFIVLREMVFAGELQTVQGVGPNRLLQWRDEKKQFLVDPETPQRRGVHRGVYFHSFI